MSIDHLVYNKDTYLTYSNLLKKQLTKLHLIVQQMHVHGSVCDIYFYVSPLASFDILFHSEKQTDLRKSKIIRDGSKSAV